MANMAIERSISVTRMAASLVISARVATVSVGFSNRQESFPVRERSRQSQTCVDIIRNVRAKTPRMDDPSFRV